MPKQTDKELGLFFKNARHEQKLTYEECMKIITEAAEKPATPKKRTTKKKA